MLIESLLKIIKVKKIKLFKSYFESIYIHKNSNVSHVQNDNTDIYFINCEFTVNEIFEILRNLFYYGKSGPD